MLLLYSFKNKKLWKKCKRSIKSLWNDNGFLIRNIFYILKEKLYTDKQTTKILFNDEGRSWHFWMKENYTERQCPLCLILCSFFSYILWTLKGMIKVSYLGQKIQQSHVLSFSFFFPLNFQVLLFWVLIIYSILLLILPYTHFDRHRYLH